MAHATAGSLNGIVARHPREAVGLAMATAAAVVIFVNALFLQPGPHPAPIFTSRPEAPSPRPVNPPASVALPSPRPTPPREATEYAVRTRAQMIAEIQRGLAQRGFYDGAVDGVWGAKTDAAAREFAHAAGLKVEISANDALLRTINGSSVVPVTKVATAPEPARNDPIAKLTGPSSRVLAIQHALADYGYGQIKPTGISDLETRAAIENFERDRKMPITGEISERLARELSAMTGRPLE